MAVAASGLFALVPAASADAATAGVASAAVSPSVGVVSTAAGLPTAAGTAACGRLGADRNYLRAVVAVQSRDARIKARTTRQRALKAARLRTDAARVSAAAARLRVDAAACDARWRWSYPNSPRLDQGSRPACELYAAQQQLNARGTRITQAMADQVTAEVMPQAPSAAWTASDMASAALARRGVRVSYRQIPATVDATLAEVQHGPVVVGVRFMAAMGRTDGSGHWLTGGAWTGIDHAVVLIGYNPQTQRVLLLNQWGRGWGSDGGMWLTRAEYARLLTSATVWTPGAK